MMHTNELSYAVLISKVLILKWLYFLLQAGTFEVLLIHLACLFDSTSNTMMFANGKFYKRATMVSSNSAAFLIDSMFDFAEHMNDLKLSDDEMALFSALAIIAAGKNKIIIQVVFSTTPLLRWHV